MASIFYRIINGEFPSYKIAEDGNFYAMLDINPNTKGHTLCIPKKEVDKITDLDEDTYMGLMSFSRKVALALEQVVPCNRVGFSVVGLEVPHVHVHLIPLNDMKDATFTSKTKMTKEEMSALAEKISKEVVL